MELSQLSATVSLLGDEWMRFAHTRQQPPRPGNRDLHYAPHGVYPASGPDRWVAMAVGSDAEWQSLAQVIGRGQLANDPRFRSHAARKANEDALDRIVEGWTRHRDRWRIAEQLQVLGIAASAVEDLRDLMDADPIGRQHYQRLFQPSAPDFEIAIDANPIRISDEERTLHRAPMLGEHNEYVLRELLGFDDEGLARLVINGVVT
jgi:crotonobetainyl-CoA:carnitine CoA-transferase CaiB-like acyl-CoA transferase